MKKQCFHHIPVCSATLLDKYHSSASETKFEIRMSNSVTILVLLASRFIVMCNLDLKGVYGGNIIFAHRCKIYSYLLQFTQ